uniref:Ig-like domain-containing protein n=1 Tax=Chelonoidis abingdonii TaxID=106734 RepID=A0A8C0GQK8_CHEAB
LQQRPQRPDLWPPRSITLDCVVSGYNINDHHLHWVRQAPGKGLVWVTAFRTGFTTFTANEFKGRVSPSTSGSTARLKIDRLTAADTATYYCARETQCSFPSFLSCSNLRGKGLLSLSTSLCMKFSPLPSHPVGPACSRNVELKHSSFKENGGQSHRFLRTEIPFREHCAPLRDTQQRTQPQSFL